MAPNFEQDIPLPVIIAGFVILIILTTAIRRKLRDKELIRQGQLPYEGAKIPSIEERVAANREWSRGEIRSQGLSIVIAIWLVAIVWNLTFGVSFFKFLSNPESKTGQLIMLGLFALGGLPFIYFALRFTIRHLRYGESKCCIQGKAGVLGQTMKGTIRTSVEVKPEGDYKILLQCLESYTTGTGKQRRTETRIEWQTSQAVSSSGQSSIRGIPFSISLPTFPKETGYQLSRGKISWQMRIDAATKGVDYSAIFIVPVFKVD